MTKEWGGKRTNSGIKTTIQRVSFGVRLKKELYEWLEDVTDNKNQYINAAVEYARDMGFVHVRIDAFIKQHGRLELDSNADAQWTFVVEGKSLVFGGTYREASATAISAALELKFETRVIELVGVANIIQTKGKNNGTTGI